MEPGKPPCLLLPTVCVNSGKSSTEEPSTSSSIPTMNVTTSSPTQLATSEPQTTHANVGIVSPEPRVAVTSNALIFHRWYAYRDERTSSSSSDSGIASLQLKAPHMTAGTSMSSTMTALSPPGLSPLNVKDSAFSTPSRESQSPCRFTFDHIPIQNTITDPPEVGEVTSAFELPSSSRKDPERLKDVLMTVRQHKSIVKHQILQRKESVIQSTRKGFSTHTIIGRAESLPIPHSSQLSVSVPESSSEGVCSTGAFLLLSSSGNTILSPPLPTSLSSAKSYRLSTSPSYTSLSPTQPRDASFISDFQISPKSFSSEHQGDDDDKKQYFCSICRKDFKRPDILSRHLRRHTGEKPFGCDACGRYFSRSDHLRTHRRTHTDEKPYQCSICPYAARRRDVLTRHMSTRHQAKATQSIFQKHRDIRRSFSDGDHGLTLFSSRTSEPSTSKRVPHTTDISPVQEYPESKNQLLSELKQPCGQHITKTSQEDIPLPNEVIIDACGGEDDDDVDDGDDEETELDE